MVVTNDAAAYDFAFCVTNLAAGVSTRPLSHDEVLETGRRTSSQAASLISHFAQLYAKE